MEMTQNTLTARWRRSTSSRRGSIALAVICAAAAGAVLLLAMARYRHSVAAGTQAATVLVASQVIPQGTSGAAIATGDMFRPVRVAANQLSAGAVVDARSLVGKVLTHNVLPGEQLTLSDFSSNGGLLSQLTPTERAVTLSLDSAHGMLGTLAAGDHVDVYAGFSVTNNLGRGAFLRLLAPDVQVLRAGAAPGSGLGGSSSTQTSPVTLAVPVASVAPLAFASDNGQIWLVLRPAGARSAPPSTITVASLLLGGTSLAGPGARR